LADQNLTLKIKVGVDGQPQVELLNTSLEKVQNTTKSMGSNFLGLSNALKGLAAAFTVREAFNFSKSIVDLGDELQKASQKTGFAVSDLSKLKATAELAGLGFDGLQTSLKKLNVNLVDAASGSKPLQDAFKAVGISAADLRNINASDALTKVAEAFSKTQDGAEKAALAVKLFGRNGVDIIPFLDSGKEGIRAFGLEISDEFAKNAEKFNDSMKLLKNSFFQIGINVIGPVLEPLRSFFLNLNVEIMAVQSAVLQLGTALIAIGRAVIEPGRAFQLFEEAGAKIKKLRAEFTAESSKAATEYYTQGLPGVNKALLPKLKVAADDKAQSEAKKQSESLADYITKQRESIALLELEGQKAYLTDIAYKELVETKKHNAETEKDSSKYTGQNLKLFKERSAEFLQEKIRLMELNEQQTRTFGYGATEAFKAYVDQATNTANLVKDAFTGVFTRLEDSLVNFVRTGKLNFLDLANFIIDEIIRIQVKQAVIAPLLGAVSGLFSSGATSGGTITPDQGFPTNLSANGNVMTKDGPMALNYYSRGGIATKPQLSIFGEGSMPEAYVPLPDGRSIPVSMKGGSQGGGTSVSVVVNVESGNDSVKSDTERGKAIGELMSAMIRKELIQQKRSGGLLA